jgi:hypothetical protein
MHDWPTEVDFSQCSHRACCNLNGRFVLATCVRNQQVVQVVPGTASDREAQSNSARRKSPHVQHTSFFMPGKVTLRYGQRHCSGVAWCIAQTVLLHNLRMHPWRAHTVDAVFVPDMP